MGGVSEDVLLARATLSRAAEPASIPLWAFVRRVGPVAAVEALLSGTVPEGLGSVADRMPEVDAHADLAAAEERGVRLVVPESEEWPHFAFACLERAGEVRAHEWTHKVRRAHAEHGEPIPPLALWVRGPGDLASLAVRSVGMVGARSVTSYGQHVARDLSHGLATRGFAVVSGGAYGVDAAAHHAALRAEGTTVLVSAGGLDAAYPPTHAALFDDVAHTGLLVSESPVGSAPRRRRFLTRNRIIAALSTGTVVVEASLRSGALNTAGHCFRLGRPVLAVPGPITSAMSAGCHGLLRDERGPALLATSVDDVLAVLGGASDVPEHLPPPPPGEDPLRARLDGVDEACRRIFDGFPARRPTTPDELAHACGVTVIDVIRAIPVLEFAGLIEQVDGGFRITRTRARARSR